MIVHLDKISNSRYILIFQTSLETRDQRHINRNRIDGLQCLILYDTIWVVSNSRRGAKIDDMPYRLGNVSDTILLSYKISSPERKKWIVNSDVRSCDSTSETLWSLSCAGRKPAWTIKRTPYCEAPCTGSWEQPTAQLPYEHTILYGLTQCRSGRKLPSEEIGGIWGFWGCPKIIWNWCGSRVRAAPAVGGMEIDFKTGGGRVGAQCVKYYGGKKNRTVSHV